jgi:methionyl-tRNA synthetase
MKKNSFYITGTIFYPNAKLHLGHAYTSTVCDILNRYHKLKGENSYFLTGADENTGKVVKAAEEEGKTTEAFLTGITEGFKKLYVDLNIDYDEFTRSTDKEKHWPASIKLWNKLVESGDIYKSSYSGLYCASCEAFYTEKDLVDGKCPYHYILPEKIEEQNYFFKLSRYTNEIKAKIESNEFEIVPSTRRNEILALLERGLEDVSFSRPIKNVPHGIPVPGDPEQVIYVWCDALVSYISGIGYGTDEEKFEKYWPADVHVIGKDILRFHAAIWPAMLMSAGLSLPKKLLVHGLITSQGKKMSKSLGNVIDPYDLINEFGSESLRYFLARKVPIFEDGDLTFESLKDAYNGELANGLGNLASRILTLSEKYLEKCPEIPEQSDFSEYFEFYEKFDIKQAADYVWEKIGELDRFIQETEPFKVIKVDEQKGKDLISKMVLDLYQIARMLNPIMPKTNETLKKLIKENKKPTAPLFLRKE